MPPASFPREKTKLLGEKTKLPGEKTKLPGEKTKLMGEKTKFARGNKHGEHHGQVQVGVAAVEEPGHVSPAHPRQLLHAVAEQSSLGPDSIFIDLESYVKFGPYSEESIYLYHLHYFLPMFSSEPKHSGLIMYPGILEAHT